MFNRSRGFRLAVDEVEKSLYLADMHVAEQYAELVTDRVAAERLFALISHEHRRTSAHHSRTDRREESVRTFRGPPAALRTGAPDGRPANRWQVAIAARNAAQGRYRKLNMPLLMTMNCVAAGLGWTG